MAEYIDRDAFVIEKRKQYCEDCERRKGMKNGKLRFCYEIGGARCRACSVDDMLGDVEDFPAADVRPVVRGTWTRINVDISGNLWVKWECSKCGHLRTEGWEFTGDGKKPTANLCEMCGADMRKEDKEVIGIG